MRTGAPVEFLQGIPLGTVLNGSGWVVAFWVTLYAARMVYAGQLVPRSTHEDTVRALELERERNRLLLEQVGRVADSLETVESVVRALPQPQQQQLPPGRRGGGR